MSPAADAPLRIAVDGRYLAWPGVGINTYLTGLLSQLRALGHQVTVLSNTPPMEPLTPDVTVHVFGSHRNIVWDQIDLPRHFAAHHYDAYWAPANNGIPLLGARPARTVQTLHDLIPLLLPGDHLIRRPLYGLPWLAEALAGAARADVIVTVSHYSAARIRQCLRRTATVIPPPAALDPMPAGTGTGRPPGAPGRYVLYNGGFDRRKRLDTLLRAMALLPDSDLHLVVLGRHLERYHRLIGQLGIGERIIAPGYVSDADRDAWVRHAWALAYPSRMEGFGLPLLEAMSAGVPVLTSDNSSLREVAGDAAGYAAPDSPQQWAQAITELDDPQVRARRIAAGDRRAGHYRSIDVAAAISEVLAAPAAAAQAAP